MDVRPVRLVLIRHGESVANSEQRFTRGPHEPLTDRGRSEAEAAARLVQSLHLPHALYSSPYARALETARSLGRVLALEATVVEDLREQSFGDLRGRPYADWRFDPAARGLGAWQRRPQGGESLDEVARRAGPALDAIARRHPGQTVCVVSHGAVMAALRGWAARDFDSPPRSTRNACGYVLEWRASGYGPAVDLEPLRSA